MGYVYILQSQKKSNFYIGSTVDLERRFNEHKNGMVESTKNLRPLELMYYKKFDTIKHARQVEYKLKKFKNRNIIEQIIQDQELKITL